MTELLDQIDYNADFQRVEPSLVGADRPAFQRLRRAALARFQELGFPGPRDEDWKFTNLAPITRQRFEPVPRGEVHLDADALRPLLGSQEPIRLVFVNGHFAPALSAVPGVGDGTILTNLASDPEQVEPHLAQQARYDHHPFIAWNTAFFQDGVFLHIPAERVIEEPIYLLFLSTAPGEATVSFPRNYLRVGRGSQVTLVENHVGLSAGRYLTSAVTEVLAEPGAIVDHYKVQQEGPGGLHVAVTQVQQERDSRFSTHYVGFGGSLVRNEVRVLLNGEGCESTVNGVYLASGTQHMDNHTVIDHAMPHCTSHELYKGILDGRARGVFNGKIFVRQDAQKTDAKQTNQTLLLSEDATINTKPQLEIYADDVKCTHGATVGQLDENALFYLRSRGIGLEQAQNLLIYAFANDIIDRIKVDSLRERLESNLVAARGLRGGLTQAALNEEHR
jgi:Fe-S cluster assembly protein SufD